MNDCCVVVDRESMGGVRSSPDQRRLRCVLGIESSEQDDSIPVEEEAEEEEEKVRRFPEPNVGGIDRSFCRPECSGVNGLASICTKYCHTDSANDRRLRAPVKRWGNRVGRWSKRWGNRLCLEANCRPFEKNVLAFFACGQSQCHGR